MKPDELSAEIHRRPVGMTGCNIQLPVRDVVETADFFARRLGFYYDGFQFAGERKVVCPLYRDNASVCLYELRASLPPRLLREIAVVPEPEGAEALVDVLIQVTDVAAYMDEVKSRGVRVLRSYSDTEDQYFVVADPNGYEVMFWH